jgi:hypothetical protein
MLTVFLVPMSIMNVVVEENRDGCRDMVGIPCLPVYSSKGGDDACNSIQFNSIQFEL